ncbi:methionine aminotransferase [Pedobacter hartonius]|uniref:2-keto-4-methylthiobutyrate aminotransferase apoenzyme n=1 Tax=Pedobacter hartonius TaxID=425514 RepID=A0A1H4HEW1_9SPHI|nr:methionine aminotransferase [Pedobacter hartonius]SEB20334.1 2-keto-4-methylthiobutyrate aminotransferase apoenzyme [Pedobacter hartonius]
MIATNSKLPGTFTNIFSVMSQLAAEHNAINLSQGFPDYDCDPKLIEFVAGAMKGGHNQYAPMTGTPALRELVTSKVNTQYGSDYNPDTEVTITAGGTQAIFTALTACIQPGDEVIIFEPAYDAYAPIIRSLGGLVKSYEMAPPDYRIDWEMVKKLFTANTKMIILNSPHNPTGTVLQDEDIRALIKLLKNNDVLILSDEVYEHLVFDGEKHRSIALYPELKERSFITASFGKLLHATGWKTGYCLAPENLMKEFRKIHQFNVFSVNTPMQVGIANYLQDPSTYLGLADFFQQKRDFFRGLLSQTKFKMLPCKGSYFQCVTYDHFSDEPDTVIARRLITDFGVAAIPVSAFYTRNTDHSVLRFCFAKKQDTLEKSVERLMKL